MGACLQRVGALEDAVAKECETEDRPQSRNVIQEQVNVCPVHGCLRIAIQPWRMKLS